MNDITMSNNLPENKSVGMTEIEARQLSEIRGKIVLAKQFPRDSQGSLQRILFECENPKLAEQAVYSYPRGDSEVTGPSIRLAEVIANNWGNLLTGVTELDNRPSIGGAPGESVVKAFAWDMETNYSDEKIFTIKHWRSTKKGGYAITDPRDIYEMVANNGARRKRACIFAVIPTYLVDAAVERCKEVLEENIAKGDIGKAREKMLEAFLKLDDYITKDRLEEKIGKDFDKFSAKDVARLKHLYSAIKDGFVKAVVAFGGAEVSDTPIISDEEKEQISALNQAIGETLESVEPSSTSGEPSEEEKAAILEEERLMAEAERQAEEAVLAGEQNV